MRGMERPRRRIFFFAAELARRYPSITSVSVHPGIIVTDLYNSINDSSPFAAMGTKTLGFFGSSVPQGACNQLWAAAGAKKADLSMVDTMFLLEI